MGLPRRAVCAYIGAAVAIGLFGAGSTLDPALASVLSGTLRFDGDDGVSVATGSPAPATVTVGVLPSGRIVRKGTAFTALPVGRYKICVSQPAQAATATSPASRAVHLCVHADLAREYVGAVGTGGVEANVVDGQLTLQTTDPWDIEANTPEGREECGVVAGPDPFATVAVRGNRFDASVNYTNAIEKSTVGNTGVPGSGTGPVFTDRMHLAGDVTARLITATMSSAGRPCGTWTAKLHLTYFQTAEPAYGPIEYPSDRR